MILKDEVIHRREGTWMDWFAVDGRRDEKRLQGRVIVTVMMNPKKKPDESGTTTLPGCDKMLQVPMPQSMSHSLLAKTLSPRLLSAWDCDGEARERLGE